MSRSCLPGAGPGSVALRLQFLDFNLPASEFAGKLSILPSTAQNQRNLVWLNNDHGTMFRRMQNDPLNHCGLQRINDQLFRGILPADQIDALSTERIDNILDAEAADTDTGRDAIHMRVTALDGQLAAVA